jgi:predicted ABC-type ATPase
MAEKLLYILGGPNGAGKTTVANAYLESHPIEYLGADKIAAELSPVNPALAIIDAGREFVLRLSNRLTDGRSCLVESTLSGKSLRRSIERARELNYRVEIQFVFIDSASLSRARVKERVTKGGHDVPDADILRRFERTFRNFWQIYKPLADYWVLTYNGDKRSENVAFGAAQKKYIVNDALFQQFLSIAEPADASGE